MDFTRPATWEDVKLLVRYLDQAGAEYALVGGYALAAHGFNRFTEDIDVLVNPTSANGRKWILALSGLPDHAAAELSAEPDVFRDDKHYAIRINDEFTVDIMPSVGGASWEELEPHIVEMQIDDVTIRVLDLPGLLKTKQGARPKDQMDAAVITGALQALDNSD